MIDFEKTFLEEYPIPATFIVDVNWKCNLKCPMCVKRTFKNPHYKQRPLEDFKKIVDRLPSARMIAIGALGDPVFYDGIFDAVKYLMAKKIQPLLTTNGTELTEAFIKMLPNNTLLYVSIDGGTQESYGRVRNTDLEKVKNNIRLLRRLKPEISVTINHLLFSFNLDDYKKIMDFCAEEGIAITFFNPIYFSKDVEKDMSVFNRGDRIKMLNDMINYANEKRVKSYFTSIEESERICGRCFNDPIIDFYGNVYPCDYCYENMEDEVKPSWKSWREGIYVEVPQYQYRMGNIYEQSFESMWNSDKWKKLRSKVTMLNLQGTKDTFSNQLKSYNPSEEFNHCRVCLARWGRCL